jgi:class 3 adenylate cyclase/ketosteroid isomerase-like protein
MALTKEQAIAEVRSTVYQMAERYGASDVDGVMALIFDEAAMAVGTGVDEVALGSADVRRMIARDVSEVDSVSFRIDNLRVSVFGEAAFTYADVVFVASVDGELLRFPARTTFGLVRDGDGWRIAQFHTSMPYGDQTPGRSFPVQLTKTLSDLLNSMDSEPTSEAVTVSKLGTATVLFTDVVDSTVISQAIGDREWAARIAAHFETVREIVEDQDGSVVKTLGDGGMYVFPSGTAALVAAIGIQRAVSVPSDFLSIRIGVHTGDVVQGDNDYIGLTVNKAARVAAAAIGEQILVSSTTIDIVHNSEFALGDPISVELKGLEGVHIVQALKWRAKTPR